MQIVVISNKEQHKEWMQGNHSDAADVVWLATLHEIMAYPTAHVVIDLLFDNNAERINILQGNEQRLVVINSVENTLAETNTSFVRIAGWNTFLNSTLIEAACIDPEKKNKFEEVLALFGKKVQWLPDEPGFISARVIGMIINEAYLALEEGVSTAEEIDTAMKLGTAYPYGPFEWGQKIGLNNIIGLLQKISLIHARYTPAPLMVQQAAATT